MSQEDKPPPCIHNDPRLKAALMCDLHDVVYERANQSLSNELWSINSRNQQAQGFPFYIFDYKGLRYPSSDVSHRDPVTRKMVRIPMQPLHKSLCVEMEAWLEKRREIDAEESPLVRGAILAVLNATLNLDDCKKLLPEILHPRLELEKSKCSCQVKSLTDEQIEAVKGKHGRYINIIKQRQLLYLLLD